MKTKAIVLAAGQGTRMNSALPKVLHTIGGQHMVWYALKAAEEATEDIPVVVIGHDADQVREAVGDAAHFVIQKQQLGTGHAVRQAETLLRGKFDRILVINADMPLLKGETLHQLIQTQQTHNGPITMLTVLSDDPHGFGRIVRNGSNHVVAIVEEADATPKQLAINELNAGVYCFNANWLWEALPRIPISSKGEYYLTDLVGIATADGFSVQAIRVDDPSEVIGVNNRVHLAEAEALMRAREK